MEELISKLIIQDSGQSFNGNDFRSLKNPGVYVFLKGSKPLYVGMSKCVLQRIGFANHLQAARAIDECDKVLIYTCKSVPKARRLERILIARLQPAYNHRLSQKANYHGRSSLSQIRHELSVNDVNRIRM